MTRITPKGRLGGALSIVLVSAVIAALAVVGGRAASGTSSFALTRVAGADRYQTSAQLVLQQFSNTPTVILASGGNYPDALAASFLGGNLGAPVLLTTPDLPMSSATTQALGVLGAHNIILLGGVMAISQAEQNQLAQSFNVTRLAGNTRYDTMQAIDTLPGTTVGTINGLPTAFLATGQDFPDALGAGPIAYAKRFPIVLTTGQSLASQAASTLQSLGIRQVLILGGTAAVSTTVEQQVNGMGIVTLMRFAGADRSGTSDLVAEYAVQNLGFKTTLVNVASGEETYGGADALSLGSVGGKEDPVPSLVTPSSTSAGAVLTYVGNHSSTLNGGYAAGGSGPLKDAVLTAIDASGQSSPSSTTTTTVPTTTTTTQPGGAQSLGTACGSTTSSTGTGTAQGANTNQRPTLASVSFVSIVPQSSASATNPAGTTLTFGFDHSINGSAPDMTKFELIPFSPGAAVQGTSATLVQSGTTAVNVVFPVYSQATLNNYTVANVLPGAVFEPANPPSVPAVLTNPEGDAPIGSPVPPAAGNTAGPDLKSAGNFRLALGGNTFAIDVSFDCGVVTTPAGATGGFHLVLTDNTTVTCTAPAASNLTASGGNAPGGSGTNVLTIVCPEPGSGAFSGSQYSAANVARLYIDRLSVTDAASQTSVNPLESVALTGGASATGMTGYPGSPDLTSVAFAPNVVSGATTVDQVTYTFDKPLFQVFSLPSFVIDKQDGSELATATGAAFASGSSTSVVVTFPQGAIYNAVGGGAYPGAVQGTNSNQNLSAWAPATGESASGVTAAPNLTGETMPSAGTVVFNFDRPVTSPNAADFNAYTTDGTEIAGCNAAPTVGGTNGNQVTCTFTVPAGKAITLGTVLPGAVTGPLAGSSTTHTNTSVFSAAA